MLRICIANGIPRRHSDMLISYNIPSIHLTCYTFVSSHSPQVSINIINKTFRIQFLCFQNKFIHYLVGRKICLQNYKLWFLQHIFSILIKFSFLIHSIVTASCCIFIYLCFEYDVTNYVFPLILKFVSSDKTNLYNIIPHG